MRVVAATNRNLSEMMNAGKFRQDLYYRLNIVRIELPPLNRRREDIPLLADHFIHKFNLKMGKKVTGVTSSVMDLLMRYPFPGNVRELENIIEHSLVLCHGGRIEMRHLPKEIADSEEIVQSLSGGEGSPRSGRKTNYYGRVERTRRQPIENGGSPGHEQSDALEKNEEIQD